MRQHTPVLLKEVIEFLKPAPGKKFIDATVGASGHTKALLNAGASVLAIDRDPRVIEGLRQKFQIANNKSQTNSKFQISNSKLAHGNFADLKSIAEQNNFTEIDGILFDLGLGSHQLDDPERGFSFQKEGPLDMRYKQNSEYRIQNTERTAAEIVNFYPEKELVKIFYQYGEEKRFGKKIARAITKQRKEQKLETTTELFELIKQAIPGKFRHKAGDTARKIFQAIRIEVNDELGSLKKGLKQAYELLSVRGILAVISFHSLEDRIVKQFFMQKSKNCICPPKFPECRCDAEASLRILTKKPLSPTEKEIKDNPRAKSAKLRVAERV